jgi:hypothetical protein
LRRSARDAAESGLYGAVATLLAQAFRGDQVAAQLQGLGNTTPAQNAQDKFSITIQLSDAAATHNGSRVIDGSAVRVPEPEPAPRIPDQSKSPFSLEFALSDGVDSALDAVAELDGD